MNLQEFIDLVNTYNKHKGEYTTEEIYQIGLAYKTLPHNEKTYRDWEWLCNDLLGLDRSPQGLRTWVNKKYNKELQQGVKPQFSLTNEQAQLYSAKQRLRDNLNDYRKLIRESSRIDEFREHLCEEIRKISPYEPVNYEHICGNNKAVALFGDLHIGCECDNYYNKYNLQIAEKRVYKWLKSTIDYIKTFNIKEINFCNIGDLIHGIIHQNIRIESEFNLAEQIIKASELLSYCINSLSKYAIVVYRSVVDNHSRAIASKDEHIEAENFCKIVDWYLKERLKNNKRIIFADSDNIDDGVSMFEINNKKWILVHGHNDRKNCLSSFVGMTKQYIDYICMGHFHCSNTSSLQDTKVFINGSFVGTDSYAFNKRLFSKPSQKLIVLKNDDVIDIDISLGE